MPKISVLVATKNREKLISGCLDSLLTQTAIKDTEIIVIDGNSCENEKKITLEYKKKHPLVKYVFTRKPGLYPAWNIGIKVSRGKYLTNLNTDDRLKNNALELMSKTLDQNPDIALVYADSYITTVKNETFKHNSSKRQHLNLPPYSHKELLIHCICGPHPMWRRKIHAKIGYFDEGYKIAGDYEFWLRIAEKYKMLKISQILGLYYSGPECLSKAEINKSIALKEKEKLKRKYLNQK